MRGKLCASLGRASVIHLYNQRQEREQKRLDLLRKARHRARSNAEGGPFSLLLDPLGHFSLLDPLGHRSDCAFCGTLSVRVVSGANLPAGDDARSVSDPYVVLHAPGPGGKKTARSPKTTVQPNTVNPRWEEILELVVSDADEPVRVFVWDDDKIGPNDLLGEGPGYRQCAHCFHRRLT